MHYGTVVEYFPAKGFGFIRPDFGLDVFFHITALGACEQHPQIEPGQMVKYELASSAEPNAQARSKRRDEDSAKSDEPVRPQAMLVELIDKMPDEIIELRTKKQPSVRHPRARHKKPSWRR